MRVSYTILLESGQIGDVIANHTGRGDIINKGENVTVEFFDENGNDAEENGDVAQVLEIRILD